jgi:hypothetical protein
MVALFWFFFAYNKVKLMKRARLLIKLRNSGNSKSFVRFEMRRLMKYLTKPVVIASI